MGFVGSPIQYTTTRRGALATIVSFLLLSGTKIEGCSVLATIHRSENQLRVGFIRPALISLDK